jgi:hypothetical protein
LVDEIRQNWKAAHTKAMELHEIIKVDASIIPKHRKVVYEWTLESIKNNYS